MWWMVSGFASASPCLSCANNLNDQISHDSQLQQRVCLGCGFSVLSFSIMEYSEQDMLEYEVEGEGRGCGCWACCVCIGAVCKIACCPPCPRHIVAKLAFGPPTPTYKIEDEGGQRLSMSVRPPESGDQFFPLAPPIPFHVLRDIRTRRGNTLCGYYLENPGAPMTLLFSHGNAIDIGMSSLFLVELAMDLGVSIFAYDYSGYGLSTGSAREHNLYADIEAAYQCMTERFGLDPSNIVVYGQSIGSAPSVHLVSTHQDMAGLILHAPVASGIRVLRPGCSRTWCCDPFQNIEKVHRIHIPTLVIHGTADEVVAVSHGMSLHERCPGSTDPLWVPGAKHNNVEMYPEYRAKVAQFLEHALATSLPPVLQTQPPLGVTAVATTSDAPTTVTDDSQKQDETPQQHESATHVTATNVGARSGALSGETIV
eukprot:m.171202 g.171202  ORF g.171202 m.171202 type:complete len:426 (-) comp14549_c0_seq6:4237-5514(-)